MTWSGCGTCFGTPRPPWSGSGRSKLGGTAQGFRKALPGGYGFRARSNRRRKGDSLPHGTAKTPLRPGQAEDKPLTREGTDMGRDWTLRETLYVRDWAGALPLSVIAEHLHRDWREVASEAGRLGVPIVFLGTPLRTMPPGRPRGAPQGTNPPRPHPIPSTPLLGPPWPSRRPISHPAASGRQGKHAGS